jgi:glycosyltransferase involved in cell wall biosynthesis
MSFRSLGIVLPAYNEEARLSPALDELIDYLRAAPQGKLPARVDVLIVDDGSLDGTADLVRARPEFVPGLPGDTVDPAGAPAETAPAHPAAAGDREMPSLRLMTIPHGGKGSAVRAGMLAAAGEVLVFADADMATPPDQLPKLVEALASSDVALGSRIQPDGSDMRASQPRFRRLVGRLFRFTAQVWATGPIRDTQCGFKGFRREAGRDLFSRLRITSIVFDVDLIYVARRRGYRMAVVPVVWADRRGSRMSARPRLALRVAWDLIRIRLVHGRIPRHVGETPGEPARQP